MTLDVGDDIVGPHASGLRGSALDEPLDQDPDVGREIQIRPEGIGHRSYLDSDETGACELRRLPDDCEPYQSGHDWPVE